MNDVVLDLRDALSREADKDAELARLKADNERLTAKRDEAWAANERDRSNVAWYLDALRGVINGRRWLSEAGRGSYAYDDDRYQQEFGAALEAIEEAAIEPLRKIARDWSNCPTDPAAIKAARAERAEALGQRVGQVTEAFEEIQQWCEQTFGPITAARIASRANEEMLELLADPEKVEEAADVVIVLSRYPNLWQAVERKMAINRARKWDLKGDGTGYHVKADLAASPAAQPDPADATPLCFTYRNYRGEIAPRRVRPLAVRFGNTDWHPEPGWLMRAFDLDKQAEREFAMADMGAPDPEQPKGGDAPSSPVNQPQTSAAYSDAPLANDASGAQPDPVDAKVADAVREERERCAKRAASLADWACHDCEHRGIMESDTGYVPCALEDSGECICAARMELGDQIAAAIRDRKQGEAS